MWIDFDEGRDERGPLQDVYRLRSLRARRDSQGGLLPSRETELKELTHKHKGFGQRRASRHEVATVALCNVAGTWRATMLCDIGAGGLAARSTDGMRPGSQVVFLMLSRGAAYEFAGRVAWQGEELVGVAFAGSPIKARPRWRERTRELVVASAGRQNVTLGRDLPAQVATNLCRGVLHVPGQAASGPVEVALELPGFGSFSILARPSAAGDPVAHPTTLVRGTSLVLESAPAGFYDELRHAAARMYLRGHGTVFTNVPRARTAAYGAGYRVFPAPPPRLLDATILATHGSAAAVIVPAADIGDYRRIAALLGYDGLILDAEAFETEEGLVRRIDDNVASHEVLSANRVVSSLC